MYAIYHVTDAAIFVPEFANGESRMTV